jgi:hypothetical protein
MTMSRYYKSSVMKADIPLTRPKHKHLNTGAKSCLVLEKLRYEMKYSDEGVFYIHSKTKQ